MIHVNKKIKQLPGPLTTSAVTELEKAKQQLLETGKVSVDFGAYRLPEVKDKLWEVFKEKCAYCETRFGGSSPGAVEHFRPKGINRKRSKDMRKEYMGYYWLAGVWDNLLLSCTDCNSERGHFVEGEKKKILLGKQDKFPLADELKRCYKYDQDIKTEAPFVLLINPCEEKAPDRFFTFTNEGAIRVNPGLKKELDKTRSQTSIDVYALRRQGLVTERRNYYDNIIKPKLLEIERYKAVLQLLTGNQTKAVDEMNKGINIMIQELLSLQDPDKEYSAMAKQLVKEELKARLNIDVDDYVSKKKGR